MSGRWELPRFNAASQNIPRHISEQSKNWIYSLAKIKFQIDRAAVIEVDRVVAADSGFFPPLQSEEYQQLADDIRKRASRSHPLTKDEAASFVTDTRSLLIWQAVYQSYLEWPKGYSPEAALNVQYRRRLSSPFVNMALQLFETAVAVKFDELSLLLEVVDAINLELGALYPFGELYGQEMGKDNIIHQEDVFWRGDLQAKIRMAEKKARDEENDQPSKFVRPPSQHAQDNFLLQTIIGIALLASIYPLYRAMGASPTSDSVLDSDFWQQIINAVVQVAGFSTLLLPIYRETSAKEWIGTWILTVLGVYSSISTIPLYLFAPGLVSVFFSWLASATQLLVVLQVALVAAFHTQQHAKKD